MNGALLLLLVTLYFAAAYVLYGRWLSRLLGIQRERPTPARTRSDGVDYVPTPFPVLFGHHFASIAGAGPIVGPVLAAYLGWVPTLLWILLGCVFVGAFHDFAAFYLSVRDDGRSIGHVIEKQMGYAGRQMFLWFCWAALVLVVTIFALLVAKTFVVTPAVATASLLFIAMAPLFGILVHRRGLSLLLGSAIFVPLLFAAVWVGTLFPCDLTVLLGCSAGVAEAIWLWVLFAYVFVASTIPVWLLLQPRDYLNSYLLYAMIALGFIGILLYMPRLQMPAFAGFSATDPKGNIGTLFPLLFVIVACGACSGFHALVASGTSAKQVASERDMLPVAYGGMLVEGALAVMALISVAYLSRADYYTLLATQPPVTAFATGMATFATRLGLPKQAGITFMALAISAFMLTTLDTATRLTRFTWQELFLPPSAAPQAAEGALRRFLCHPFSATAVAVGAAAVLAFSGGGMLIWPVFGASNQLLAALTLLSITLFFIHRRLPFWIAFLPMLFMLVISGWALLVLLGQTWGKNPPLFVATQVLLLLAVVLAVQAVRSLGRARHRE